MAKQVAPKFPLSVVSPTVSTRSAWRAKKGDAISMRVGGVTIRLADSAITFSAEAVVTFANENDHEPELRIMLPRNRFAPIFETGDKTTAAALDAFLSEAESAWVAWFDKQTDQPSIVDPKAAIALIGNTGGKRGTKLKAKTA